MANTLDTQQQQHTLQGARIRRLTPIECARLQGFPDDWHEGVFIPKIDKRKCAQRDVIAIIENNGRFWVGSNWCNKPQEVCPRGSNDDGVYDKCWSICEQDNHAEVDALKKASKNAFGATLYLIGHDHCCQCCKDKMAEYGIANIVIGEYPKIKISDSQAYRCYGNAVTVNIVELIAKRLK